MKLVKEPKDIDFTVDGRELTAEEHQKISDYIQRQRVARMKKVGNNAKRASKELV